MVAYLEAKKSNRIPKDEFSTDALQHFSADSTIFWKEEKKQCPWKILKNTVKSTVAKKYLVFFGTAISCPKRPKQKNSCSKIWLIDQLYIKLGFFTSRRVENVQLIPAHLQNKIRTGSDSHCSKLKINGKKLSW